MQIHLRKAVFLDDRFFYSLHKSFLNQTTLDLRKEKLTFLNWEFTVVSKRNSWVQKKCCWMANESTFPTKEKLHHI